MQKRDDLEFRGNAVLSEIDANQNAGSCQHCHFRMANLKRLTARQRELHRLKWTTTEHLSKSLNCHDQDYSGLSPVW